MIDANTMREIAEPRVYLPRDAYRVFPRYTDETEEEHIYRCRPSGPTPADPQPLPSCESRDLGAPVADPREEVMRTFVSGATRDTDKEKLDYEGFLSPFTLPRYAEYMHSHRRQSDGELRDSDNWQKGIPLRRYMKSLWRHLIEAWIVHRLGGENVEYDIEEALCAVIFNASGYLHELLKGQDF